jgi:hypothetical protein
MLICSTCQLIESGFTIININLIVKIHLYADDLSDLLQNMIICVTSASRRDFHKCKNVNEANKTSIAYVCQCGMRYIWVAGKNLLERHKIQNTCLCYKILDVRCTCMLTSYFIKHKCVLNFLVIFYSLTSQVLNPGSATVYPPLVSPPSNLASQFSAPPAHQLMIRYNSGLSPPTPVDRWSHIALFRTSWNRKQHLEGTELSFANS